MIALWRNLRLGRQIQLTLLALLSLALLISLHFHVRQTSL